MLPLFGLADLPMWAAPWSSLLITSLLVPKARQATHSTGDPTAAREEGPHAMASCPASRLASLNNVSACPTHPPTHPCSFVGHLAGILAGYAVAFGLFSWLTPWWTLSLLLWSALGLGYAAARSQQLAIPYIRLPAGAPGPGVAGAASTGADVESGGSGGPRIVGGQIVRV